MKNNNRYVIFIQISDENYSATDGFNFENP